MKKPRKAKPYQFEIEAFCESKGFAKPETEVVFHPTRKWRFDFSWKEQKVALEVDGGVYAGGRHTTGKGFEGDCEKTGEAVALGWKVLRVSTGQLKKGLCWAWLEKLLVKESYDAIPIRQSDSPHE